MVLRKLTPEEEAVFDAIIAQRKDSIGYIFIYDMFKAQKFLNDSGTSIEYSIDFGKQFDLIKKMADDGILKIDYLDNLNFGTGKTEPRLAWIYNTDWAYETFQLNGLASIEECYAENGCILAINLPFSDIKLINDNCRARHKVTLALNEDRLRFYIRYNDSEDCYYFPPFKDDSIPYQIARYAMKKPGKKITSDELERNGINIGDRYLKSQVFSDNVTVTELLSQFIELTSDSIKITPIVLMSTSELDILKAAAI